MDEQQAQRTLEQMAVVHWYATYMRANYSLEEVQAMPIAQLKQIQEAYFNGMAGTISIVKGVLDTGHPEALGAFFERVTHELNMLGTQASASAWIEPAGAKH